MQQGDKLLFFKLIAFTLIAHTTLVVKACEEACTPNEIEKQEEEIYDAIGRGNLSRVKEVLKAYPEVRKVYEKEPYFTPFHRAAACNQPEIIKYLASHTNINVDTRYMNGETPT